MGDSDSECDELLKQNKLQQKQDNKIKLALHQEIDELKKKLLSTTRENNKLNKRLAAYEEQFKQNIDLEEDILEKEIL